VADSQSASILTLAWLSPKRRAILLCERGVGFFERKGGHFTVMVEAQKFVAREVSNVLHTDAAFAAA